MIIIIMIIVIMVNNENSTTPGLRYKIPVFSDPDPGKS